MRYIKSLVAGSEGANFPLSAETRRAEAKPEVHWQTPRLPISPHYSTHLNVSDLPDVKTEWMRFIRSLVAGSEGANFSLSAKTRRAKAKPEVHWQTPRLPISPHYSNDLNVSDLPNDTLSWILTL
ncbi:MAG: hypothetical protein AAF571_11825 [Verrucomicrobiota bacterium]